MWFRSGVFLVLIAYLMWGLTPLYYQYLPNALASELLAERILWSIPFLLIVRIFVKDKTTWHQVWKNKRSILLCLLSTSIMVISWSAFIYALTHKQVLAASLGYFINPLFTILLGMLFLKETLSSYEKIAVVLIASGIIFQIAYNGEFPLLAMLMGCAFAFYSLVRKYIEFDTITSLVIEAVWLVPLAIGIIIYLRVNHLSAIAVGEIKTHILYMLTAPVTVIPLLFFNAAVKKISLTVIGLAQYIEPTIHFLLAIFLFNEVFNYGKGISFGLIWIGLIFCVLPLLFHKKRE